MGKIGQILKIGKLVYANLDKIEQVIGLLEQLALVGKQIIHHEDGSMTIEGSDKVWHKS